MVNGQVLRVHLTGGAPWGFRLQGGVGTGQPVTISRIRRRSKAHLAKLQEGDEITLINGRTCKGITRDQAMTYIDNATETLDLEILRGEQNNNEKGAVNGTAIPQTSTTKTTTTTVIKSQEPAVVNESQRVRKRTEIQVKSIGGQTRKKVTETVTETRGDDQTVQTTQETRTITEPDNAVVNGDASGTIEFNFQVPKFSPTPVATVSAKPGVWSPASSQQQQARQPEVHKTSTVTFQETVKTHETPRNKAPVPYFTTSKTTTTATTATKPGVWQPGGATTSTPIGQPVEVEFTLTPGGGGHMESPIAQSSPITANDISEDLQKDETDSKANISILDDPSLILAGLAPGQKSESTIEAKKKAKDKIKMHRPFSYHGYSNEPEVDITVDDQKKLCKQIADLLMFPMNKQARGARMFAKRRKKAAKYTVEGIGQRPVDDFDTESMPDLYQPTTPGTPFNPMTPQAPPPPPLYESDEDFDPSRALFQFRIPSIKPTAAPVTPKAPRTITIEPTNFNINLRDPAKCRHQNVSPGVCGMLAADLKSIGGRASEMFAKRQKRVQKFVLEDENKAKTPQPIRSPDETDHVAPKGGIKIMLKSIAKSDDKPSEQRPQVAKHKTPWEAAMESPQGSVDKAFEHIDTGPTKVQVNIPKHMIPKAPPPPPAPKPKPTSPRMPATSQFSTPQTRPFTPPSQSRESVSPAFKVTPLAGVKPFDHNYNRKIRGWAPVAITGDKSADNSGSFNSAPKPARISPSSFTDYNPKPRAWTPGGAEHSTPSHDFHSVKPVVNPPVSAPVMMESEDL